MKTLILIIIAIVGVLALVVAVVALVGSKLPVQHTASHSIVVHQSPQQVYDVIRDFASAPSWRSDLKSVEVENQLNGKIHFRENSSQGTVNYELVEDIPAQRMVTRILDTDLGYSGKWTYAFTPEAGGTRVTITEDGEVSNVIFRFMSRYVFGHTATMDSYLTSLGKKFGEDVKPS
ncbi:MAG TPA: SRPBCC family protein [Pyrinomonadaceae bacterium]